MPKFVRDTLLEKLWKRVAVNPEANACWLWTGSTDGHGYGQIASEIQFGSPVKTHRASWELAYGEPIPPGMFVCHKCDTPACVRPSHLFVGTAADNMNDCSKKGRVRKKLTAADACEIRGASGTHRDIATRFSVTKSTVTSIKAGRIWKYAEAMVAASALEWPRLSEHNRRKRDRPEG
jgi:hypothetical protein